MNVGQKSYAYIFNDSIYSAILFISIAAYSPFTVDPSLALAVQYSGERIMPFCASIFTASSSSRPALSLWKTSFLKPFIAVK